MTPQFAPALSANTKAILLLTAPLIAGRGSAASPDLITPGEYKRLARRLRELERQPADLIAPDAADLLTACGQVVAADRLQRLLSRGFLLSQTVERWFSRSLWVVSRADADYPRVLKARLREDAPAVLYGCGDREALESGGLAVVGSRQVDDALLDYTLAVGRLAARHGRTLISGCAKGVDQAAMRGALEEGGVVCGVLADNLEKSALNREHRNLLLDGRLTLISPYDPNAGFHVGSAMQRNKLIYALANAALVVNSDYNKGGTWAGAVEQLEKLKLAPIYIRSTGAPSPGLEALQRKGALLWPNPQDRAAVDALFHAAASALAVEPQNALSLFVPERRPTDSSSPPPPQDAATAATAGEPPGTEREAEMKEETTKTPELEATEPPAAVASATDQSASTAEPSAADRLFATVRVLIAEVLTTPMNASDLVNALNVTAPQAKLWLQRLETDGVIEKKKKPAVYVLKETTLL